MSFKLLAIRPLNEDNPNTDNGEINFNKILRKGLVYQFYNDYIFKYVDSNKLGEIESITYRPTIPENLYRLKEGNPQINISAIVGTNGSGKSAITELLLYSIFQISIHLGFVEEQQIPSIPNNYKEDSKRLEFNSKMNKIYETLKLEIFYLLDEKLISITIDGENINILEVNKADNIYLLDGKEFLKSNDINILKPFFYSVLINYSLYAFNANQIGAWLNTFFHKNDGYQMPIVINPYREYGIIDINREDLLTRSRLLTNLLTIPQYRNLNPKSPIAEIGLYYNSEKDYNVFINKNYQPENRFSYEFILKFREKILVPLFDKTFNKEISYPNIDATQINIYAEKYLINKIITISGRYSSFYEFDKRFTAEESLDNFDLESVDAEKLVNELYNDKGHITLKVRQTLNFIRKDIYGIPPDGNFQSKVRLSVIELQLLKLVEDIKDEIWFTEVIDYLPPPFLFCKIQFKDGSFFHDLSSGEKQRNYTLNTIIYHLKNLDSVFNKGFEKNKEKQLETYSNVNLIMDEIELYHHPEYQKNTISDLLFLIEQANFKNIRNINILFLTHSPFILSDIPQQNILHLIDGKPENRNEKTFGANVHDLLANDFFLENGFMGEWAKKKIQSLISYLTNEEGNNANGYWNETNAQQFISIIAEPLISERLWALLDKKIEKSGNKEAIAARINHLQKLL